MFDHFPEPDTEITCEADFQNEVLNVCCQTLESHSLKFSYFEGFGLDLGFFIQIPFGTRIRFIEIKQNRGQRNGGIGIGNSQGIGAQVDLLIKPDSELTMLNQSIQWAIMDCLLPVGSDRFALFDNAQAKSAVMAGAGRGKQNNLSIHKLKRYYVKWPQFVEQLQAFILNG